MAKYDPLRDYLQHQTTSQIELALPQIEAILGGPLPRSAQRPNWWANGLGLQTTHVQSQAWLEAGYQADLLANRQAVRFRRAAWIRRAQP